MRVGGAGRSGKRGRKGEIDNEGVEEREEEGGTGLGVPGVR